MNDDPEFDDDATDDDMNDEEPEVESEAGVRL